MEFYKKIRDFTWRVSDCEELVGVSHREWMSHLENNLLPVQSDMHTFLVEKLSRLWSQFLRGCMDNVFLNADKWISQKFETQQTVANTGVPEGTRTTNLLIRSPYTVDYTKYHKAILTNIYIVLYIPITYTKCYWIILNIRSDRHLNMPSNN